MTDRAYCPFCGRRTEMELWKYDGRVFVRCSECKRNIETGGKEPRHD